LSPDTPTIQRAVETSFTNPLLTTPSDDPSVPSVQRTPETKATPANEPPPFQPINRYRDPRVLARAVEPSQPVVQSDLPLNRSTSAAVLPQARTLPAAESTRQSTGASTLQRTIAETAALNWPDDPISGGFGLADRSQLAANAPVRVQRSPERHTERTSERTSERSIERATRPSPAVRAVPSSTPATRSATVQRAPLPLAKLPGVTTQDVIQRSPDKEETFVGSSKGVSRRALTQTENLKGKDEEEDDEDEETKLEKERDDDPCEDCDKDKDEKEAKELERLARAILPVVKRMLAIERDRANPRPRF
jgi:hypothetical protein